MAYTGTFWTLVENGHFDLSWSKFGQGHCFGRDLAKMIIFDHLVKIGSKSGDFGSFPAGVWDGPFLDFWANFLGQNRRSLRNVVFGEEVVKMAQKQHIGNFQI